MLLGCKHPSVLNVISSVVLLTFYKQIFIYDQFSSEITFASSLLFSRYDEKLTVRSEFH